MSAAWEGIIGRRAPLQDAVVEIPNAVGLELLIGVEDSLDTEDADAPFGPVSFSGSSACFT